MNNNQQSKKCCDTCKYYHWYYDKCNKYDCEVDARSVCAGYEPYQKGGKMRLLIDIDENDYEQIKNGYVPSTFNMFYIIQNGTLLPKEYGRLVDADAYAKKYDAKINGRIGEEYVFAPTIIEANTESEG